MTSPVSTIEAIEKFGPDADWDVWAHVRLLRANGGASSGYTADLIQNLHCTVVALARQAEALTGIGSAHDLISDWLGEGTDDLPDDTPVRIEIGKRTIIADNLGSLRRARTLLGGSENAE